MSLSTGVSLNPLHSLERTIDLFQVTKFYHEGFIFRRTLLLSDGLPPKRSNQNPTWSKYYVQISGTTMSCWDAKEIEIAAQEGRQVAPTYTNITDARVDTTYQQQPSPSDQLNPPTPHVFFLNNAGRDKLAFACFDHSSLVQWVAAIRLSSWERSRLFEIYTGTLFGLRFPSSTESSLPHSTTEGYLMVRFPKDTDWTKVWCQLVKGKSSAFPNSNATQHSLKWNQRRTSLFQLASLVNKSNHHTTPSSGSLSESESEPVLMFYSKKGAKKHIALLHTVSFAAAIYPESRSLIDSSTIFKVEGQFERLQSDPRPSDPPTSGHLELESYILASPDEGTEYDMFGWLLSIMSAFRLYGRPQTFNYDLGDPKSFYFAYPTGPEREKLFLDCRHAAANLDPQEQSLDKLRRKLIALVTARLSTPGSPVVHSSAYEQSPPPISSSIADPEACALDSSAQANPQASNHPLTPSSLSNETLTNTLTSEDAALTPDQLQSDPYSTSETLQTALSGSAADHTSTHARSPVDLAESEEVKFIQPSESISIFDGELQSLAAYVTFPAEDSEDTSKMLTLSTAASSEHASSSVKFAPESQPSVLDKPSQPSSESSPSSPTTSHNAPPIKISTEADEYDDMVYALNLMDDLALADSSTQISNNSTAQEGLTSPKRPSPQPDFLSKPPPDIVEPQTKSLPASPDSTVPKTSFPSSFAAGKKSAARLAAAQAAQATEKALVHRPGKPGRGGSATQKKPSSSWNSDSDDDEEEDKPDDDEEDDEEDERLKKHRLATSASMSNVRLNDKGFPQAQDRNNMLHPQVRREAVTSMYSTFSHSPDGRPMSHFSTNPNEMGQFPNAAARREMPAVLREQPAESIDTSGMRPAFSQHGLLNRVMQERQERSAKSIQEAAHWNGEPLVQVNHKPPPIQSGLLGAIASHEKDRKRDGGIGAVLTERARERAMRQREADEYHRQSMYGMIPTPGYAGAGYPPNVLMNSAGLMPMMFNPQLVPNPAAMAPNPNAIYEQMLFQQHQMQLQQQAMMNAQQVYASPYGYPGMTGGGGNMNMMGGSGSGGGNVVMMPSHQSMYGFPNQSLNFNSNNNYGQPLSPNFSNHIGLPHSLSSPANLNQLNNNTNNNQTNLNHNNQKNQPFNSINSRSNNN